MENNELEKSGTLRISERVVASIAKIAISDVKGVDDIVPVNGAGLDGIIAKAKRKAVQNPFLKRFDISDKIFHIKDSPIKVRLLGDVVEITISVTVIYGYNVMTVAENIQEAVKSTIQNMVGITVSRVNVNIAGISIK